jgi:predicted nucleic acid-binding protein
MSALKTLDALQLASALDYKALDSTFVCSDHNLIQAAHAHGLNTLNPVSAA